MVIFKCYVFKLYYLILRKRNARKKQRHTIIVMTDPDTAPPSTAPTISPVEKTGCAYDIESIKK